MITYNKRGFQLSLITIFTTLLFLGTVGINTALATDQFIIKVAIKEVCFDGPGKPFKRTIKSGGIFAYTPNSGNLGGGATTSPFPLWDSVLLQITNFELDNSLENFFNSNDTPGNAGIALSKNLRKGTFHTFLDSSVSGGPVGTRFMALSGKLVVDKDGEGQKVFAKITGYDGTRDCTYNGKFKGKRQVP